MRHRWLLITLLAGLALGILSCAMVLLTVVPAMSARTLAQDGAGNDAAPVPQSHEHEQPPQNMQDLAKKIMDIAYREQGQYRPVEFVRIGEDEYLILIAGTQIDSEDGNNPESAGQEVTRQSSPTCAGSAS
jgi:hypothetical protein